LECEKDCFRFRRYFSQAGEYGFGVNLQGGFFQILITAKNAGFATCQAL
jgi:hypothetical protein